MKIFSFILVIIYLMPLLCCAQKSNVQKKPKAATIQKEKLILYHEDSSVQHTRQQLFLQNLGRIMELPTLSSGKNGLYIRVWLWNAKKKYVIDISENEPTNKCHIVEFNSKKIDSNEYIAIHHEWKNLKPKSGWSNFFSTLKKYQIVTMESGKSAKEQRDHLTDMAYIQFEISQLGQYRFYEYLEPSYYRYVEAGAMNVYQFLNYFNKEMDLPVYKPADNAFAKPK